MAKWEIAVWGKDEEDTLNGDKRIKAGDIVAIKPYPATWGPKALQFCVITIVDGLTEEEVKKFKCNLCGYIYDPEKGDPENGIEPGTAFEDLPDDWVCPMCGAEKSDFSPV